MNKKASHVDWAISMGIFLVYIIGMFILLRPGVTPVHKPEGLLKLVEDRFNEEVMWEVREIPLFIEICKPEGAIGEQVPCKIEVKDENDPSQFTFSKIICEGEDCSGEGYTTDIWIECVTPDHDTKPNLGDNTVFKLTYHIKDNAEKDAKPELNIVYPNNDNEDYCKAYLGASISKFGVNWDWVEKLKDETYGNGLKSNWNFPLEMDFAIYVIQKGEDLEDEGSKKLGANEPQGVNIFTKEFKTQRVNKDGGITIPVIVNIRVW